MLHTRIKTLRTLKNISQKSMAASLHKSQSAYSRMESGELQISSEDLKDIAVALGCKPEDLLNENGVINVLQHNQNIHNLGVNYGSHTEVDSKAIQLILDNQNKLIEEMKTFINTQSQQMIALVKEVMQSMKK